MRVRNVGENCGDQVDNLQAATTSKSAGRKRRLEEATRDLPSRDPEGLKGRDVAGFGLGIGGSAATQPKKHRGTQRQVDWGLPRAVVYRSMQRSDVKVRIRGCVKVRSAP